MSKLVVNREMASTVGIGHLELNALSSASAVLTLCLPINRIVCHTGKAMVY